MRLQAFQLSGDAILDLLTDSPEAARLVERPVGVVAEGVRTASATSADEPRRRILRQVMEDERSRARQVIDDGEFTVRRQVQQETLGMTWTPCWMLIG
eukprot:Skav209214  [mRNA]  locus=scaffold1751:81738:88747:- [translate_table: standard]